jgi:hypothetical protein
MANEMADYRAIERAISKVELADYHRARRKNLATQ